MEDEQVIREKMEETRTSLSEKLETLENKVVDTVKEATEAVSDTVETVKDTVQETVGTVKGSVESAVGTVKGAVTDGVETVKDWLDLSAHVENHPWCAMAAAVAAGYCLETLLEPRSPEAPQREAYTSPARPHNGRSHRRPAAKAGTMLSALRPEINQLKGLALGAMLGVVREMIVQAVPRDLGHHLKEVIDNATKKLGGEPLADDSFHSQPSGQYSDEEHSRMRGPMGP
jgi:ElaB/YqjD/DUF883 family membrane-anchored ribosome-binding protein